MTPGPTSMFRLQPEYVHDMGVGQMDRGCTEIGGDVGHLTKMINENNNDIPDTTEANVGCEKTHHCNKTWTLRCGKDDWKGKQVEWADEVRMLSNQRIMI